MTIYQELAMCLKKDGLCIEDLTTEQLELAREEIKERMSLGKGDIMKDEFFSSMDYIGLTFRKK